MVVGDELVLHAEDVHGGDAQLGVVGAGVGDRQLLDDGVVDCPVLDDLVAEALEGGEELADGLPDGGAPVDGFGVPEAEVDVFSEVATPAVDVEAVGGLEHGAADVGCGGGHGCPPGG